MQKVTTDRAAIDELLSRGVDEVIGDERLQERLYAGERLRIKLGIDPTSPHLHLGRSVPILKMRDFQQLGHQLVLIVGDFTGIIGDASDKDSERPMLSHEVIEENKKDYFAQLGTLIDLEQAQLRYNSEWLAPLTYREIGEHANLFSVAEFTARENVRKRLDAGKRVSLREMLYPLMQGYDSVAVEADVEIGGVDQRFNLLAGRTLQDHYKQEPQALVVTTFPIEGLDGRKMSSSWGNTINFRDEAADMFGKVMSLNDELIERYADVLTRMPRADMLELADLHPRDAKMRVASEIVTLYHGADAAADAAEAWRRTFSEGEVPDDVPEQAVAPGTPILDALLAARMAASKGEARRLLAGGGVTDAATGDTFSGDALLEGPVTVRIGKKRFVRFTMQ